MFPDRQLARSTRPRRKDAGAGIDGKGWAFGQSGKT
jgi:hypothetical protein